MSKAADSSTSTRLAEVTLETLNFFKKEHTSSDLYQHLKVKHKFVNAEYGRLTVKRLRGAGYLEIASVDPLVNGAKKTRYRITALGLERLRIEKTARRQAKTLSAPVQVNAFNEYGHARHTPMREDHRSITKRKEYVPPKEAPVRAGSLDFKSIPSGGI